MANKRVLGVFTLNCVQTGHWVRVDYYIMMDWAHVLVIVQCQTDGCSLSCKDGAVVWQSFSAVGGRLSRHSGNGGWWPPLPPLTRLFLSHQCRLHHVPLVITKLIELSLGFLSRDYAFTYSFNEVVSLGIVIMRSWWEVGCPLGQTNWALISAEVMTSSTLRPMGGAGGRVMPPLPFGLGAYKSLVVRSNSCRAWCAGVSMQARVFT